MKFTVNPQIDIQERDTDVLAVYPDGFRARLSRAQLPVIGAFRTPADRGEVIAAMPGDRTTIEKRIGQLIDLVILVPDDAIADRSPLPGDLLIDPDSTFREILRAVRGYTMGTPALCHALYQAVRYIQAERVPGAIVETGVWRGGNIALCALALMSVSDTSRELYLFDTFDWSWPQLTSFDTVYGQESAAARDAALDSKRHRSPEELDAEHVSEARVRAYLAATGYPAERFVTVRGLVQDTLPDAAPAEIALLRLDTDLYESTYHELVHLYPRLARGGVLIIDDYPTERGCVKAVEQYFQEQGERPLLSRIDTQGRIGVKR